MFKIYKTISLKDNRKLKKEEKGEKIKCTHTYTYTAANKIGKPLFLKMPSLLIFFPSKYQITTARRKQEKKKKKKGRKSIVWKGLNEVREGGNGGGSGGGGKVGVTRIAMSKLWWKWSRRERGPTQTTK